MRAVRMRPSRATPQSAWQLCTLSLVVTCDSRGARACRSARPREVAACAVRWRWRLAGERGVAARAIWRARPRADPARYSILRGPESLHHTFCDDSPTCPRYSEIRRAPPPVCRGERGDGSRGRGARPRAAVATILSTQQSMSEAVYCR